MTEHYPNDLLSTWHEASLRWWRHQVPHHHFRTSLFAADRVAEVMAAMVGDFLPGTNPAVLDLGAGCGELAAALHPLQPRWPITSVDVRPAPDDPPPGKWLVDAWDVRSTGWTTGAVEAWWADQSGPVVVIAHEFLDELPCEVGRVADPRWADRWWPDATDPDLPEIGRTRDRAWADVVGRLRGTGGLALMVDYGHLTAARPTAPTLRGFVDGRVVPAAFDTTMNLTADVAIDAVAAAARAAGGEEVWFARQDETIRRWLGSPPTGNTLTELTARNRFRVLSARQLAGRSGLGAHWWLAHRVPAD